MAKVYYVTVRLETLDTFNGSKNIENVCATDFNSERRDDAKRAYQDALDAVETVKDEAQPHD